MKARRLTRIISAALILAVVFAGWGFATAAMAQSGSPAGPTAGNCYSTSYHAASDCDRIASSQVAIPATGVNAMSPTTLDCYSARFHAASDCDRLSLPVGAVSNP